MNDWLEYQPVDAKLIERYKREWKERGFPDVSASRLARGREPACSNDPISQPTAEQWLWVQVILEAVNDINRTSMYWNRHCVPCHDGQPCGHVIHGIGQGNHAHDQTSCPYFHTNRDCAVRLFHTAEFRQVCDALGLDADYMRKKVLVEQTMMKKRVGRPFGTHKQTAAISQGPRPSRAE